MDRKELSKYQIGAVQKKKKRKKKYQIGCELASTLNLWEVSLDFVHNLKI